MTDPLRFPLGWKVPLLGVLIAVVGILLWFALPPIQWLSRSTPRIHPENWGKLFGLLAFSVSVTQLIVHHLMIALRHLFDLTEGEDLSPTHLWPPVLLGCLESVLYPSAMLLGESGFIGIWLALKVAGQWRTWGKDRRHFVLFLIGNALIVSFAMVTYILIRSFVLSPAS